MTEDTSPENLLKFLESDDPAMVMMGLSMAKSIGVPENMLPLILSFYFWSDSNAIRNAAKKIFFQNASPNIAEIILNSENNKFLSSSNTSQ